MYVEASKKVINVEDTSLLRYIINYSRKMFYDTDPFLFVWFGSRKSIDMEGVK